MPSHNIAIKTQIQTCVSTNDGLKVTHAFIQNDLIGMEGKSIVNHEHNYVNRFE